MSEAAVFDVLQLNILRTDAKWCSLDASEDALVSYNKGVTSVNLGGNESKNKAEGGAKGEQAEREVLAIWDVRQTINNEGKCNKDTKGEERAEPDGENATERAFDVNHHIFLVAEIEVGVVVDAAVVVGLLGWG